MYNFKKEIHMKGKWPHGLYPQRLEMGPCFNPRPLSLFQNWDPSFIATAPNCESVGFG